MSNVMREVARRKKRRQMSPPRVMSREGYRGKDLDTRLELIRALVPIGLMQVYEEIEAEVTRLAGRKHARKSEGCENYRHCSNPGSVGLAGQRVPVTVKRVRNRDNQEVPLESYRRLHARRELDEGLFRRVLYGISCRNYEAAAEVIPGAIGLSSSTVSRRFVEASGAKLREFQERDLSGQDVVVIFIDGKTFADDEMVLALGVTLAGKKVMLGFVQTSTENARVLTGFLGSLRDRGLSIDRGVLVVVDGSKGLRAAVKKAYAKRALVQRCQWHKRENIVAHLAKSEQRRWRRRLQQAYQRPTYEEAKRELKALYDELLEINESAARSLEEGLEETLTLHRLGLFALLGRSFKTTNCIESINGMVEQGCSKVDVWKNSNQKQRWFGAALLDIEPRLRKVMGHRHLYKLRAAIMRELGIKSEESTLGKAA